MSTFQSLIYTAASQMKGNPMKPSSVSSSHLVRSGMGSCRTYAAILF